MQNKNNLILKRNPNLQEIKNETLKLSDPEVTKKKAVFAYH
ncbi:hypothetical protein [Polaribacter sp. OB-PA-B3]